MKPFILILPILLIHSAMAEDAAAPVPFPKLDHFAALWERSIFTTKDLPSPDAPAGPNFTDSLGLSALYEYHGEVVVLIVDKATSQVHSVKIGSENQLGIKVRKIEGEITDSKVRVQLQKGDQAGWITLSDGAVTGQPETVMPAGLGTPNAAPLAPALAPNPLLPAMQQPPQRRSILNPAPTPVPQPAATLPQSPAPQPAPTSDIPLPPP